MGLVGSNQPATAGAWRISMFLRDLLIPSHLLLLLGLFLLFFGSKKLPEFGKGLGDGIRSFKNSVKEIGGTEK
jgi:TatA/E family protein of Tat protein translocase